jgi:hypothetical protein
MPFYLKDEIPPSSANESQPKSSICKPIQPERGAEENTI